VAELDNTSTLAQISRLALRFAQPLRCRELHAQYREQRANDRS
jgi:hypothetical protein